MNVKNIAWILHFRQTKMRLYQYYANFNHNTTFFITIIFTFTSKINSEQFSNHLKNTTKIWRQTPYKILLDEICKIKIPLWSSRDRHFKTKFSLTSSVFEHHKNMTLHQNPSPSYHRHRGHRYVGSITVLGGRRGHTVWIWRARSTSTAATAAAAVER